MYYIIRMTPEMMNCYGITKWVVNQRHYTKVVNEIRNTMNNLVYCL